MNSTIILKGNILYTPRPSEFVAIQQGYVIAVDGVVVHCGESIPPAYGEHPITDYGDHLIIPGFVDTHAHAPQYCNRGLGMDKELLPWLETYTFPEEAKFSDQEYARLVYGAFVHDLWRNGTTRSILFGTIHKDSTLVLMELLQKAGLSAYVGKVNMDRNSPEFLIEDTQQSLADTKEWLEASAQFGPLVKPIITPRFVPSCTSELMSGLGNLAEAYNVPVQSHLSENHGEIEWVAALHPEAANYTDVYYEHHLMGKVQTVMAHCIHLSDVEMDRMAETQTMVSHCPYSNVNLSSGIALIRKLFERKIPIGLGSDISGGHIVSMAKVLTEAIGLSKMKWVEVDQTYAPLTLSEAFYMATKGGGKFFGKVGSFEKGCELDALVIDDTTLFDPNERSLEERLERWLYVGDDRHIVERYVAGKVAPEPTN